LVDELAAAAFDEGESGVLMSSLTTAFKSNKCPAVEAEYSCCGETTVIIAIRPDFRIRSASSVAAATTHTKRKMDTPNAE